MDPDLGSEYRDLYGSWIGYTSEIFRELILEKRQLSRNSKPYVIERQLTRQRRDWKNWWLKNSSYVGKRSKVSWKRTLMLWYLRSTAYEYCSIYRMWNIIKLRSHIFNSCVSVKLTDNFVLIIKVCIVHIIRTLLSTIVMIPIFMDWRLLWQRCRPYSLKLIQQPVLMRNVNEMRSSTFPKKKYWHQRESCYCSSHALLFTTE